jgi:uncharacterized membrane protein (TIGR02234 family)
VKIADPGFGRTVGPGVLLSAVGVIGASRSWAAIDVRPGLISTELVSGLEKASPVALSLTLVTLASWGTFLVTRGRLRILVAYLAATAAAGVLLVQVLWLVNIDTEVRQTFSSAGVTDDESSIRPWFWVTLVCTAGALMLSVMAARAASGWPEMGRRYDAPGTPRQSGGTDLGSPLEVWRALDEGHDPTDPGDT